MYNINRVFYMHAYMMAHESDSAHDSAHLRPILLRSGPLDDLLDGVLPGIRVLSPHVDRLRIIDEFYVRHSRTEKATEL